MGSIIQCFFLEPVGEAEESLRRYVSSMQEDGACSGQPCVYHNAEVVLGRVPWTEPWGGRGADDFDHADPRWPVSCGCGYVFKPEDPWQHNLTQLYVRQDTGDRMSIHSPPAGAMWYADWLGDVKEFTAKSPDGRVLMLQTPGGPWNIDSGWTRTGVPPKVTANPSILAGKNPDGSWIYHGWLRDGELREV